MNRRRIEHAAKCAVYHDINKRLLNAGIINQAMFDFAETEVDRIERMPIYGDEGEEAKLARNVRVIEPTKIAVQ